MDGFVIKHDLVCFKHMVSIGYLHHKKLPGPYLVTFRKPDEANMPRKASIAAAPQELAYNVYSKDCPARMVFDRLTDKWTLLILGHLRFGTLRFNQLRRDIEGVSQKVLSQTLKKLERDGLIQREVFATMPVTVEYSLTQLGTTLTETIETLTNWAQTNIEAVHAAQQRYDAMQA